MPAGSVVGGVVAGGVVVGVVAGPSSPQAARAITRPTAARDGPPIQHFLTSHLPRPLGNDTDPKLARRPQARQAA